ncbi:hypothetical protein [uncultured Megasphaera sp.]|uniref:hypothetical protein n=1 Tax=uncultured Megasphaera sp. TaxID=165188 RepID=UPI0025930C43|nr:hypothetical protein [uncultured Megasphaera sp.]
MDKELKEKLQDPGLAGKLKTESDKLEEEFYLKDLQFVARILDIPIDKEGSTICTEIEQLQFLALLYGILLYQIARLEIAKNSILADIKKRNGKIAEDLINLKLLQKE